MASTLNRLKQEMFEMNARKAKLVADIDALPAPDKRTAAQATQYATLDSELSVILQKSAPLARELADATRAADHERRQGAAVLGGDDGVILTRRGRLFSQMFPRYAADMGGWSSAEEFLSAVQAGLADARLVAAAGSSKVPSDGGFSVPTQMFGQWLDTSLESEIVRSRADVVPMTSSEGTAPGWDDADHSSTLYGGISGEWIDENGSMTVQAPKMRNVKLRARKLALLTKASNELAADGNGYESQLGQAITRALGWFLDKAFLQGTGAGQPLGILNAPCTIAVSKEAAQTAATVNYTNLTKMFARLHPASIPNSVWVCNNTLIPQLLQLTITVGTGGSIIPVMTNSNGQFSILTRPVIFTEKVPAVGTKGDVILADWSQYVIGLRADFSLAKSGHVYFANDESAYRGIIRVDGQPKLNKPVTPNAGDTLSPFVVLETRS